MKHEKEILEYGLDKIKNNCKIIGELKIGINNFFTIKNISMILQPY